MGYTTSITQASGAANYILWLRARKPVMQETPENKDKGPGGDGGEIALHSTNFQYPGRTTRVLKDINMTIKHGVRSFRWPVWLRQVYNDQPLGTLLRSHNR